jgi:hypothetical protein
VGGKGGGGGSGEKWPKPCMHIWIIKLKKIIKQNKKSIRETEIMKVEDMNFETAILNHKHVYSQ